MVDAGDLNIPNHLAIATEVRDHLAEGWTADAALIAGIAGLENFVRTNPNDTVLIDAGPRDSTPITKHVIGMFENLAQANSGQVSYGFAAIQRLGVVITAVRALEVKTQDLERRLAELENNGAR